MTAPDVPLNYDSAGSGVDPDGGAAPQLDSWFSAQGCDSAPTADDLALHRVSTLQLLSRSATALASAVGSASTTSPLHVPFPLGPVTTHCELNLADCGSFA